MRASSKLIHRNHHSPIYAASRLPAPSFRKDGHPLAPLTPAPAPARSAYRLHCAAGCTGADCAKDCCDPDTGNVANGGCNDDQTTCKRGAQHINFAELELKPCEDAMRQRGRLQCLWQTCNGVPDWFVRGTALVCFDLQPSLLPLEPTRLMCIRMSCVLCFMLYAYC